VRAGLPAVAVAVMVFAAAGRSPARETPIVVEARFDTATEQVQIPVSVNGASFWCSLDSGFSALIAIDEAKAARAGFTSGATGRTPDGAAPRAGDSGLTATVTIAAANLGPLAILVRALPAEAPDMECVMGVGVLRRFVVEFDHIAPRILLHERDGFRPGARAQAVPLIFRSNLNVPFVDVALTFADGTRRSARVVPDTGASYYAAVFVPVFTSDVRRRMPRAARPPNRPAKGDSPVQLVAARPAALSIGPFTMREPVVALLEADSKPDGIDDGLLGSGFLRRFTVAFDFEGRSMYLEPNERFAEPHAFDASGVGFRHVGRGYEVDMVLPDSPAATAGIRAGDRLVAIDGRLPRTLTPVQLRGLLSRSGTVCDLYLDRGGQVLELRLELEARL
jgi:hypothetical protein